MSYGFNLTQRQALNSFLNNKYGEKSPKQGINQNVVTPSPTVSGAVTGSTGTICVTATPDACVSVTVTNGQVVTATLSEDEMMKKALDKIMNDFSKGNLRTEDLKSLLDILKFKYTEQTDGNKVSITFKVLATTYTVTCVDRAAAISGTDNKSVTTYTASYLNSYLGVSDVSTLERFFVPVVTTQRDLIKGTTNLQYVLKPDCGYKNLSEIRTAINTEFENFKKQVLIENYLSGYKDNTEKEFDDATNMQKLHVDGKSTSITKNNYSTLMQEVGAPDAISLTEEQKQEVLNKALKDFASGNMTLSVFRTLMVTSGIGVESYSARTANNVHTVSFKFAGKNYSITCNKVAATSAYDDNKVFIADLETLSKDFGITRECAKYLEEQGLLTSKIKGGDVTLAYEIPEGVKALDMIFAVLNGDSGELHLDLGENLLKNLPEKFEEMYGYQPNIIVNEDVINEVLNKLYSFDFAQNADYDSLLEQTCKIMKGATDYLNEVCLNMICNFPKTYLQSDSILNTVDMLPNDIREGYTNYILEYTAEEQTVSVDGEIITPDNTKAKQEYVINTVAQYFTSGNLKVGRLEEVLRFCGVEPNVTLNDDMYTVRFIFNGDSFEIKCPKSATKRANDQDDGKIANGNETITILNGFEICHQYDINPIELDALVNTGVVQVVSSKNGEPELYSILSKAEVVYASNDDRIEEYFSTKVSNPLQHTLSSQANWSQTLYRSGKVVIQTGVACSNSDFNQGSFTTKTSVTFNMQNLDSVNSEIQIVYDQYGMPAGWHFKDIDRENYTTTPLGEKILVGNPYGPNRPRPLNTLSVPLNIELSYNKESDWNLIKYLATNADLAGIPINICIGSKLEDSQIKYLSELIDLSERPVEDYPTRYILDGVEFRSNDAGKTIYANNMDSLTKDDIAKYVLAGLSSNQLAEILDRIENKDKVENQAYNNKFLESGIDLTSLLSMIDTSDLSLEEVYQKLYNEATKVYDTMEDLRKNLSNAGVSSDILGSLELGKFALAHYEEAHNTKGATINLALELVTKNAYKPSAKYSAFFDTNGNPIQNGITYDEKKGVYSSQHGTDSYINADGSTGYHLTSVTKAEYEQLKAEAEKVKADRALQSLLTEGSADSYNKAIEVINKYNGAVPDFTDAKAFIESATKNLVPILSALENKSEDELKAELSAIYKQVMKEDINAEALENVNTKNLILFTLNNADVENVNLVDIMGIAALSVEEQANNLTAIQSPVIKYLSLYADCILMDFIGQYPTTNVNITSAELKKYINNCLSDPECKKLFSSLFEENSDIANSLYTFIELSLANMLNKDLLVLQKDFNKGILLQDVVGALQEAEKQAPQNKARGIRKSNATISTASSDNEPYKNPYAIGDNYLKRKIKEDQEYINKHGGVAYVAKESFEALCKYGPTAVPFVSSYATLEAIYGVQKVGDARSTISGHWGYTAATAITASITAIGAGATLAVDIPLQLKSIEWNLFTNENYGALYQEVFGFEDQKWASIMSVAVDVIFLAMDTYITIQNAVVTGGVTGAGKGVGALLKNCLKEALCKGSTNAKEMARDIVCAGLGIKNCSVNDLKHFIRAGKGSVEDIMNEFGVTKGQAKNISNLLKELQKPKPDFEKILKILKKSLDANFVAQLLKNWVNSEAQADNSTNTGNSSSGKVISADDINKAQEERNIPKGIATTVKTPLDSLFTEATVTPDAKDIIAAARDQLLELYNKKRQEAAEKSQKRDQENLESWQNELQLDYQNYLQEHPDCSMRDYLKTETGQYYTTMIDVMLNDEISIGVTIEASFVFTPNELGSLFATDYTGILKNILGSKSDCTDVLNALTQALMDYEFKEAK